MNPMARHYADDDGRTVADMSALEQPGLRLRPRRTRTPASSEQDLHLDRAERRAMVRGAVSAGLLVAGTLALGFAVLILLIQLVWH